MSWGFGWTCWRGVSEERNSDGAILLDDTEVDVSEDVGEILNRIVNSRDGLRHRSGTILAPAGWVTLTAAGTGDSIFVQVTRIGYVRED